MRMVAHLRVSTARKTEKGCGLQGQERAIRICADRHGVTSASVFVDAVYGATRTL